MRLGWIALAFLLVVPTNVRADGECFAGYRDTTPDERAAMRSVLEKALRAVPPAPEGWVLNSDDGLYVRPSVCQDDETQPWSYDFTRSYLRVDDLEERDRTLDAAADEYQAAMQAKQPRMDAIMARIQELAAAAVAAGEKGDLVRVDAINLEIEQASAELEAVMAEGGTVDKIDAAGEEASRDRDIRIEVEVNASHEPLGYRAAKVTGPAGAKHAFRWSETRGSVTDATALILFGQWRATTTGDPLVPVPQANAAPTAAQAISIRVTADESRIDSVLDSIDFEAFAALLSR